VTQITQMSLLDRTGMTNVMCSIDNATRLKPFSLGRFENREITHM